MSLRFLGAAWLYHRRSLAHLRRMDEERRAASTLLPLHSSYHARGEEREKAAPFITCSGVRLIFEPWLEASPLGDWEGEGQERNQKSSAAGKVISEE